MYQPTSSEFTGYYGNYINKALPYNDLLVGLQQEFADTLSILENLSVEQHEYRYAEGKWTIKELLVHMIDTERIFAYRALRFARQDTTILQGYDENLYAATSKANQRSLDNILAEWKGIRAATYHLFASFDAETLLCKGNANGYEFSVRALGYIIVGHEIHHKQVLKERYL